MYNSKFKNIRYYNIPLYGLLIVFLFSTIILPIFDYHQLGFIILELTIVLAVIWESIWIVQHVHTRNITILSILRIGLLSSFYFSILLNSGQYLGNSLFFGEISNVDPLINFFSFFIFLLFLVAMNAYYYKFVEPLKTQHSGFISWKRLEISKNS